MTHSLVNRLLFVATLCAVIGGVRCSWADGIQMLPPVDPTQATAAGCSDGSTSPNRVLTWDGSTAIKCSDKLKADSNGNITANAVTVTGSTTVPACGSGVGGGSIYFDASTHKFMGCDGSSWTVLGSPKISIRTTLFTFSPLTQYLDCPSGYTAIACNDVVVPSGSFSCQITPGSDPNTNMSACVEGGCSAAADGDNAYYGVATCVEY